MTGERAGSAPAQGGGLADLLEAEELERLRAGFSEAELSELATQLVVRDFPPAGGLVTAIQDAIYLAPRPLEMSAADRERVLIALLTAQGLDRQLAVHVYWGLMVGLTPRDVAETVVLTGVYAGLARQNAAMGVLRRALTALKDVADDRRRRRVPISLVLPRLLRDFPA